MMSEFEEILAIHRGKYPAMEPQDYGKLAFQSEFGPEHLVTDRETVLNYLYREYGELAPDCPAIPPEAIGNGLCRFHLSACRRDMLPVLAEVFCRSAAAHKGSREGLEARLLLLRQLDVPGMEQWLAAYESAGCPAVRHSQTFRDNYSPHYRVIKEEYLSEMEKAGCFNPTGKGVRYPIFDASLKKLFE